VTNLFNTLCAEFYQNQRMYVEDMTLNILAYFFSGIRCSITILSIMT